MRGCFSIWCVADKMCFLFFFMGLSPKGRSCKVCPQQAGLVRSCEEQPENACLLRLLRCATLCAIFLRGRRPSSSLLQMSRARTGRHGMVLYGDIFRSSQIPRMPCTKEQTRRERRPKISCTAAAVSGLYPAAKRAPHNPYEHRDSSAQVYPRIPKTCSYFSRLRTAQSENRSRLLLLR